MAESEEDLRDFYIKLSELGRSTLLPNITPIPMPKGVIPPRATSRKTEALPAENTAPQNK